MFLNVWNTDFAIIDFESDEEAEQWQKGCKDVKRAEDWDPKNKNGNRFPVVLIFAFGG